MNVVDAAERTITSAEATALTEWNAYRRGDTISQLKWRRGGAKPEAFPEPV